VTSRLRAACATLPLGSVGYENKTNERRARDLAGEGLVNRPSRFRKEMLHRSKNGVTGAKDAMGQKSKATRRRPFSTADFSRLKRAGVSDGANMVLGANS
jgi:hypothetical protein